MKANAVHALREAMFDAVSEPLMRIMGNVVEDALNTDDADLRRKNAEFLVKTLGLEPEKKLANPNDNLPVFNVVINNGTGAISVESRGTAKPAEGETIMTIDAEALPLLAPTLFMTNNTQVNAELALDA